MKSLSFVIFLLVSLAARADGFNQSPQDIKRKQLLNMVCQDEMNRRDLEARHLKLSDDKMRELDQLKVYYPLWFKKDFKFEDCPNEFRGVM